MGKILCRGNGGDQFNFKIEIPDNRGCGLTDACNPHRSEAANVSVSAKEKFEEFTGSVRARENDPLVSGNTRKSFCHKIPVINRKYLDQGQFQDFRSLVLKQFLQSAVLTDRAGNNKTPTKQRTDLEPILRPGKPDRISDKNDCRRSQAFLLRQFGKIPQRPKYFSLIRQGPVANDGSGLALRQPSGNQLIHDFFQFAHAHVYAKRTPGSGKFPEIDTQGFLFHVLMSRKEGDRRTIVSMGQWNAGIGSAPKCRSYPGHDLVGYSGIVKERHLLRATSENKRVSPLEANHLLARFRSLDKQLANLFLLNGMAAWCLANVDELAPTCSLPQKVTIDQIVIDQDVTG